jgi:hypothetical protein
VPIEDSFSSTASSHRSRQAAARRPHLVAQYPDAFHLKLDHVTHGEPATVVVLQDAAGAHRPRAEDITRPQHGVAGRLRHDGRPAVVQVAQVAPGSLLAVDPRRHDRVRAVELVGGDEDRAEADGEVFRLGRAEPDPHLLALDIPRRPVVHHREAADLAIGADDRRHLKFVVKLGRAVWIGDLRAGADDRGGVREVEDRERVPLGRHGRAAIGPRGGDMLLESEEVADRRRPRHRGEQFDVSRRPHPTRGRHLPAPLEHRDQVRGIEPDDTVVFDPARISIHRSVRRPEHAQPHASLRRACPAPRAGRLNKQARVKYFTSRDGHSSMWDIS